MKKIYLLMALCLFGLTSAWADADYCHITSAGYTDMFIKSNICDGNFDTYSEITIALFNNPAWDITKGCSFDNDGSDAAQLEISLDVSKRSDLRGSYTIWDGAYVYLYVFENGDFVNYDDEAGRWDPDFGASSGTIIVTLSEDGEHYDLEYNLSFPDEPNFHGYVYGICDSKMADNLQAIENVQRDKVQSTKVLRNGILLLEYNGKTYNAQGIEVK